LEDCSSFLHYCYIYYYCSGLFYFYCYYNAESEEHNNNSIPWNSLHLSMLAPSITMTLLYIGMWVVGNFPPSP
jgi:hypothetical protein